MMDGIEHDEAREPPRIRVPVHACQIVDAV